MGLARWLVEKERRFAWSLIGTIVGFISLYLGYVALRDKHAEITFGIISDANVLDVHTAVPSLEIRFQGEDIEQKSLNLRVLTVQLENTGEVAILQNQYDQAGPWGFTVGSGRPIEVRLVRGNDRYLQARLRPTIKGDSIVFDKPIFERGSFVVLEVLVLHPRQVLPVVLPYGKVAGISAFRLRTPAVETDSSVWIRAASGSAGTQALRLGIYTFASLAGLILVAGVGAAISAIASGRARNRRKREVEPYLRLSPQKAAVRGFFAELYVDAGLEALLRARNLLANEARLRREMIRARSMSRIGDYAVDLSIRYDGPVVLSDGVHYRQGLTSEVAMRLFRAQIVQLTDERRVKIAEGANDALSELILMVKVDALGDAPEPAPTMSNEI